MIERGFYELPGVLPNKPLEFNTTISVVVPSFCTTTKWSFSEHAGSIRQLCILCGEESNNPPLFSNRQTISSE
jgi:hypothetical protein